MLCNDVVVTRTSLSRLQHQSCIIIRLCQQIKNMRKLKILSKFVAFVSWNLCLKIKYFINSIRSAYIPVQSRGFHHCVSLIVELFKVFVLMTFILLRLSYPDTDMWVTVLSRKTNKFHICQISIVSLIFSGQEEDGWFSLSAGCISWSSLQCWWRRFSTRKTRGSGL